MHKPRSTLVILPLLLLLSMPAWPQCVSEICDGLDNDCDGYLDEGCVRSCDLAQKIGSDTPAGGEAYGPSLVWNGSIFAAVGTNSLSGGSGTETLFRHISETGVPQGVAVHFSDKEASSIVPASGNEYAVVWRDFVGNMSHFALIDSTGNVIAETPLGDDIGDSRIVWTGTEFGVALQDLAGDHHLLRVSPLGTILGSNTFQSGGVLRDLAWSGSEFGVLIEDSAPTLTDQLYFSRLDALGNPIGLPRQVSDSAAGTDGGELVWASGEWGAAWQEDVPGGEDIFFARIDLDGQRVGAVRQVTDLASSRSPSLAWSGVEYALSFIDWRVGHSEVYFARLDAYGDQVSIHERITTTDPSHLAWTPAVAWSGSGYGIAYVTWRGSGDPDLYFSAVDCPCYAFDPDGDGVSGCDGDCGIFDGNVYPGAVEICDGIANDCLDEAWPRIPLDWDNDGDGITECQGDCNDGAGTAYPGATEVCDSIDNDCDTMIDEDASGEDDDNDRVGNLCDNCLLDPNPTQSDRDLDAEGDVCDVDDGFVHVRFDVDDFIDWDPEGGYDSWNSYRGSLAKLIDRGLYTQKVMSNNPGAAIVCQIPGASPFVQDTYLPDPGDPVFYLTTGNAGGIESGLGDDSSGAPRPNDNSCP